MNWPATPTLAGRHVTLRPTDRADRAGLLAVFGDGFEYSFASMVPGEATIDGWFDAIEREIAVDRARVFTVLDADGQIAGTTRFLRMNRGHRRVELGGTLYAGRVRRTGLNTEAKRLLLGYAFEVLDLLCVQIRTDFLNVASRRAIERLGARQDGILRGHMVIGATDTDQRQRDTVVYSILAHEWPGVMRHLDGLLDR
jgi:RimJ/RimL family protein N-acetyltransferase